MAALSTTWYSCSNPKLTSQFCCFISNGFEIRLLQLDLILISVRSVQPSSSAERASSYYCKFVRSFPSRIVYDLIMRFFWIWILVLYSSYWCCGIVIWLNLVDKATEWAARGYRSRDCWYHRTWKGSAMEGIFLLSGSTILLIEFW